MLDEISTKNIIVFGESGSGKSSVINLLINKSVAPVSDRVVGCTMSFKKYDYNDWTLFDTAGLSEGSQGTVNAVEALTQLKHLLDSLRNGISLGIMVIEKSRITKSMEQNYNLFAKTICMGKVPILLMVTKCEEYENMDDWWDNNKSHFDDYGMKFADVVCGCAKNIDNLNAGQMTRFRQIYEEQRGRTRQRLIRSINENVMYMPWSLEREIQWIKDIIKGVLNILVKHYVLRQVPVDISWLINYLVDMGWTLIDARVFANTINDIIRQ